MTIDALKGEIHILREVMPFPCMIQSHVVYIDVHVEGTELTAKGTIIWSYCPFNPFNYTFRANQCRRIIVLLVHMLHVCVPTACATVQGQWGTQRVIRVDPSSLFHVGGEGEEGIKLPYLSKEADPKMSVHWDLI